MTSLKDKVEKYLKTLETYTIRDVYKTFPDDSRTSLKGIYYRYKKNNKVRTNIELRANLAERNIDKSMKVKLEVIEPIVAQLIDKQPTPANIRLGLDLIKLKQVDTGIDDELDISKYIEKAQEVLDAIES